LDLIQELKNQGKTMIISTHVLPDADHVCDYIGVLNQGKLVFCGSVMEMKQFVRENVVDLGLSGDIQTFQDALTADDQIVQWERMSPDVIRVNFSSEYEFSKQLSRLLEMVGRLPVELQSIRSGGEIEDAFLKRLEADRLKGFNRVFDGATSEQSPEIWPSDLPKGLRVNGAAEVAKEVAEEQKV
jgi:ABC-2 type transport system ATP-binding protein